MNIKLKSGESFNIKNTGGTSVFATSESGATFINGVGSYDGTNPSAGTNDVASVIGNIKPMTETTWSVLKSLRDSSGLMPGMQYRITDYNTTTSQANTQSANHQFDIIVTADDNHTLNENARAIRHTGDTYFSASTLDAWELKYDIDNDTTKYAWADSGATGRGVIYYMKDEWGNECPYDFKNIQFARWELSNPVGYVMNLNTSEYETDTQGLTDSFKALKTGLYATSSSNNTFYFGGQYDDKYKIVYTIANAPTYIFTFGTSDWTVSGKKIYNNAIKEYYNANKLQLNNIVFLNTSINSSCNSNTFGTSCQSNTFGNNCDNNTFGNNCYSNTFGNSYRFNTFGNTCRSNTFGNDCIYNTFGNTCDSNTFGNTYQSNTFGSDCRSNTFGTSCQSNTFGNNCYYNTFGNNCRSNTFSTSCQSSTFGNTCRFNTFGNNCRLNTFGTSCQSNTFGSDCHDNTFGNNCRSNTFGESVMYFIFGNVSGATTTAQTKDYIQNVIVENGVQYVNAYCTGTTSSSNYCQNIRVCLGVKGTNSSNRKQIDITSCIGSTVNTIYANDASGNTVGVNIADIAGIATLLSQI